MALELGVDTFGDVTENVRGEPLHQQREAVAIEIAEADQLAVGEPDAAAPVDGELRTAAARGEERRPLDQPGRELGVARLRQPDRARVAAGQIGRAHV